MSRAPEEVNKLTESTYKNVMEQFNPGLRNLVNLGKSYEKSVTAMTFAGKAYFDAVSKIGENAAVSPVSRELGVVLMEIAEVHKKVQLELEMSFMKFHKELIAELEKKTDMDIKYMNATFKRYQSEHKFKQDFLDKSQADLKKLRRKSQGKHSSKYEIKENECLETISSRQTEMQSFIAEGCKEALMEEKRRFCFLVDKHCAFSYQLAAFHDKAKEILTVKLPSWQDKCTDVTGVPDTVISMIEGLRTMSVIPESSPSLERPERTNSSSIVPPPAPSLKAHTSPLASMFTQDIPKSPISSEQYSDLDSLDGNSLSRSTSVSSGMDVAKKNRVQTIFPHTAGSNETLLSFDDGDIITLLIQEERDGWLYGELEHTGQRGWFPSSYCRTYTEPVITNRVESVTDLPEQPEGDEEVEEPVLLPPPDYSDSSRDRPIKPSTPSPQNTVSLPNGHSAPPFLGGGNPFSTVKLRPTITNDRSAPHI
ncbi:brain-specific angiogenesis inhibitor 1-associated protein 2-like protein 1a [Pimephales promelas]|uniref:brain-specific angiogenesis inhibitor 1-associated protein 2-like protein 1a n=1 Tax=Pimephales promelas TaxID=90988 RepID=UPI001955C40C|nr:brain-specific angiogenesis inhibitor 1-associated protein 2-like protein 1a [Pimephales promelas]KAG1943255.1 brain-specific angiogenesis inhibitor 1-associated protein [Pimephales promelas]